MQNQFSTTRCARLLLCYSTTRWICHRSIEAGVGRTSRKITEIATIMPTEAQLAVSISCQRIDLPLLDTGRKVRIQFDGWPAIVFSGWPGTSYGTYGGIILQLINLLTTTASSEYSVKPDPTDHPGPTALRVGSGAIGMCLFNNVPIWYELWRKINGFPPDFYYSLKSNEENKNNSATTKSFIISRYSTIYFWSIFAYVRPRWLVRVTAHWVTLNIFHWLWKIMLALQADLIPQNAEMLIAKQSQPLIRPCYSAGTTRTFSDKTYYSILEGGLKLPLRYGPDLKFFTTRILARNSIWSIYLQMVYCAPVSNYHY